MRVCQESWLELPLVILIFFWSVTENAAVIGYPNAIDGVVVGEIVNDGEIANDGEIGIVNAGETGIEISLCVTVTGGALTGENEIGDVRVNWIVHVAMDPQLARGKRMLGVF
jgi:hypothetical protein